MDIRFVVKGHSWKSEAGKTPEYKVTLKSKDGHALKLIGSSKGLFEAFPKDEIVDVKIGKAQRTLDEIPGQGE